MVVLKILAGAMGLYCVVLLVMTLVQDRLLFPRWAMRGGTVPLPAAAERLSIESADGKELAGVFLPAEGEPPAEAALLLGFGGNAWDADLLALYLKSVFPARDVVTFHYRGYGRSAGRPGAAAILSDAVRIHDAVVASRNPGRVVAIGLSLGSGPASRLASRRPIAGVILVTAFDSLTALAREHVPWVPVRLLLRHRMDVADDLARSSARAAIITAGSDEIVPAGCTDALRGAAGTLLLDRVVEGVGHNDIYESEAFLDAMHAALSRLETEAEGER